MKDLLILKDAKGLDAKKVKKVKKPSGIDFASLLFDNKNAKNTPNLFVMQNTFKAKNSIKLKQSAMFFNKLDDKNEPKLLASLLQNSNNLKGLKIVKNAKEMNDILPKRLQISQKEIVQEIKEASFGKELLDDLNFVQVLDFLELLKQDKKDAKLHDFFSPKKIIEKIDIKKYENVKNVHSLIELAKEHKLGLKNVTYEKIQNNEYNEEIFKKPYPKLFENNFFVHKKNEKIAEKPINEVKKINLESLLKEPKIELNVKEESPKKNMQEVLKTGALNELLNESKTDKKVEKNTKPQPQKPSEKQVSFNVNQANSIQNENLKTTQEKSPQNDLKTEEKLKNTSEEIVLNEDDAKQNPQNNEKSLEKNQPKVEFANINKDLSKDLSKEQIRTVLNNFTKDFKEELEKFKAPSHRVNISLNPKELGEVNVTMIARGNNLHVNLNSNNHNTLNLFIANQQEFKNSLLSVGFAGLSMNFGDKKDGQNQEQKDSKKKYEKIEDLEELEAPSGINAVLYKYL